jgi:hypothetical protein
MNNDDRQLAADQGQDLRDRLTRVEVKLDGITAVLSPQHSDHETRIRVLEARVWWAAGFAAAPGVVALFKMLTGG